MNVVTMIIGQYLGIFAGLAVAWIILGRKKYPFTSLFDFRRKK